MRELLPLIPKPSRYLGIEEGAILKNPEQVNIHIALAFPDMYEVGMSYLGQKILYGIINDRTDWWAERVYTPCVDTAAVLKEHNTPLATLEADTPLCSMDMVGFHVTHELCYTNVLYMLELGQIPLRSADRGDSLDIPIIAAGGGCTLGAEPLAPFIDVMVLGEGEEVMVELLDALQHAKDHGHSRHDFLVAASKLHGIYIPSFFKETEPGKPLEPLYDFHTRPTRRVIPDMNDAKFPISQPIPFGAVHSRLALEIGRGCTRGCRFCQAGIIYRPARERSVEELERIMHEGLTTTGYDDLSFLSLSTGDFSALKTLFTRTVDRCSDEQISVSLPSLRVGSIDDDIMERMAGIRRTGATLAPEAGSQRMRDVINKGVTEEELITHIQKLFQHGWQQVKLYFMIGLPTETKEDLDAIVDLCRKARDAAGKHVKRLQITAAISPFVPKAHTPFQWEAQISLDEIRERVFYLKDQFDKEKRIKMRWHQPTSSALEGIFSRGDRRLADVVETAYRKGAVFSSWMEHFRIEPYLESLEEHGLTSEEYTGARNPESALPWAHLNSGVTDEFLLKERDCALKMEIKDDCRYGKCHLCGVCDVGTIPSQLDKLTEETKYQNILNQPKRDQEGQEPIRDDRGNLVVYEESGKPPKLADELGVKATHVRVWYAKEGPAIFLSQLELQSILERVLRRAEIPMTFSQGFHPLPLISFGKALPVGVASKAEWVNLYLRETRTPEEIFKAIYKHMPRGMKPVKIERLSLSKKQAQPLAEEFVLEYKGDAAKWDEFAACFDAFAEKDSFLWTRDTKKGERTTDIRPLFHSITMKENREIHITFDWSNQYASPLNLVRTVAPDFGLLDFMLTKVDQHMG